jgi:RecJ-like exonuclease
MSSCIICGESVDGRVCDLHEEDVVFEFQGTEPDQLTPNRYYRGTVDGYADFGIFVDIGDDVTGLLHRSELDRRLESVDLEPGDTVFVQVQDIRDNGNVDLSWSIRQDESRFRGALVDTPEGDQERSEQPEDETDSQTVKTTAPSDTSEPDGDPTGDGGTTGVREQEAEPTPEPAETPDPVSATVAELDDHVGDRVRIEGEIVTARQTSGPTVFELRDETGSVECAAFEEAGVRAYPEVEEGDAVRIEGEVERRHGDLQVETEGLAVLDGEESAAVTERLHEAMVERARPESVDVLSDEPPVDTDQLRDVATAIRRAVIEDRPVVVRHAATVDGYVASAAIERATLALVRDQHTDADAEYHYFERRPVEGAVYDMDDATRDVTRMLSNRDRHDEQFPLFVFVGTGTRESVDGFDLLDVYGARRAIIDERAVEPAVADAVDVVVSPGDPTTTATVLGANVAANVNPTIEADLRHLPAVSFWEDTPQQYADLAAESGYDAADTRNLREAVALEAYYQSYEDKRELIIDLLFADEADVGLAEHISEQFRTRMETAVETAEANLDSHDRDGQTVLVLDTEAYTHRYEFPPETLLLDVLYREHRDDAAALVGVGRDEAHVRSDSALDVRTLVEAASEHAPAAALDARGAREGRIEFLAGEREAARDALLDGLAAQL